MALSSQYWPRAANWQGCAVIRGWVLEMWRLAACHAATTAGQTRRGGSRRAEFYTRPRLSVAAGSRTFRFDKRSRELGRLSAVRRGTQRMLTPSQLSPQRERHALPLWPGAHSYIYIYSYVIFVYILASWCSRNVCVTQCLLLDWTGFHVCFSLHFCVGFFILVKSNQNVRVARRHTL